MADAIAQAPKDSEEILLEELVADGSPEFYKGEPAHRLFATLVSDLRSLQTRIDDVAEVAASKISRLTSLYSFRLERYSPFLKAFVRANAKKTVDKTTGEIREAKSYKTIDAGGGGFFRTKRGKVTFAAGVLDRCFEDERYAGMVSIDRVYGCLDPLALANKIIELEKKEGEPFFDVQIIEDDHYGKFQIGAARPWSPDASKNKLSAAVLGKLTEPDEESEDAETH